jgi:lipoprotein-anchoring transpeptidase ErfK/SrfK
MPPPPVVATRPARRPAPDVDPSYFAMYDAMEDGPHLIEPVDLSQINPRFLRREVEYSGREAPGSIVVDVDQRHLYYVMHGGRAMRYGVGVGREEAFNFKGLAVIQRKAEWPGWTPTPDMIKRDPERYEQWKDGMAGGPENPLGARALYLYRGGKDTYYRLHGTNEPYSIGTMVSSGCVRLLNQDIIDLYERVAVGAKVDVRSRGGRGPAVASARRYVEPEREFDILEE